jgi:uncharacterized iron-regulated membrane protein
MHQASFSQFNFYGKKTTAMTFKQITGKLHLWLGLGSGLVVFILGITGCFYAFVDELRPMVYKDRMYVTVPPGAQRQPLAVMQANAQKALGADKPLQVAEVPTTPGRTVYFRAVKVNEDHVFYNSYLQYYYRVYVNPYTGAVIKIENTKYEFFNVVLSLHINLLMGPVVGAKIVSWSVVIFVVLLLSGLVLWWPKNKAAMKQRAWFKWKKDTKWKRKNYDLHNIFGFYAMALLLVIALTGLVWSFEWFKGAVQWIGNGGKPAIVAPALTSDTLDARPYSMDRIRYAAGKQDPAATSLYVTIPKNNKAAVSVYARNNRRPYYTSTSTMYDQHSGAMLRRTTFARMSGGEKVVALNYDLHVGSLLGLPGKMLAFFASLIAASLPVTGIYIWWGRKNKKTTNKKKMAPRKTALSVPA